MTHTSRTCRSLMLHVGVVVAFAAAATPTHAQSLASQTRGGGPINVISANPFLPLFGYFQGEYEHLVRSSVAVAVAGSHIKFSDTKYTNLDVKLRLYPSERGLEGFNVAASLGIATIKDEAGSARNCDFAPDPVPECVLTYDKFGAGAFAVELAYQWLLGPSKVMAVSAGLGAKRYIASKEKFDDVEQVVPTLRLTIGYAF